MQPRQKEDDSTSQPTAGFVFSPEGAPIQAPHSPVATQVPTEPRVSESQLPHSPSSSDELAVSWTASEYISHQKNSSWFMMLGLATMIVAGIVFFLTKDAISTGMMVLVGIAFGGFAHRQPKTVEYTVDQSGIQVGQKEYPYELFKSFSVLEEGALYSVFLLPLKRFMPPISMYYAPEDEDRILDVLSIYLPFEEREHDVMERVMRKIRF